MSSNHSSNLKIVESFFQSFAKRNWHEMEPFLQEEIELLNPGNKQQYVKRHKIHFRKRYCAILRNFINLHEEVTFIHASGNRVFVQFLTSFHNKNGQVHQHPAWSICTVENQKIKQVATFIPEVV